MPGRIDSNITATTSAFKLQGGKYGVSAKGTWGGGSSKLQILLADNTTFVSVASGTDFTADGYATVDLPPGQYRWTVATATALYHAIARIPYRSN
jgi:hypothetical protein